MDTCAKEKILCIIPARGGSKGVKRKNIRDFNGKPLIGWTMEEAKKSTYIDRIIVSTEDGDIASVSSAFGASVMKRPVELAQDTSSTTEVILHILDEVARCGYTPEYLLLLQCTSPMRKAVHVDEAIRLLLENRGNFHSLISVTKESHPPFWLQQIDEEGCLID